MTEEEKHIAATIKALQILDEADSRLGDAELVKQELALRLARYEIERERHG